MSSAERAARHGQLKQLRELKKGEVLLLNHPALPPGNLFLTVLKNMDLNQMLTIMDHLIFSRICYFADLLPLTPLLSI